MSEREREIKINLSINIYHPKNSVFYLQYIALDIYASYDNEIKVTLNGYSQIPQPISWCQGSISPCSPFPSWWPHIGFERLQTHNLYSPTVQQCKVE